MRASLESRAEGLTILHYAVAVGCRERQTSLSLSAATAAVWKRNPARARRRRRGWSTEWFGARGKVFFPLTAPLSLSLSALYTYARV